MKIIRYLTQTVSIVPDAIGLLEIQRGNAVEFDEDFNAETIEKTDKAEDYTAEIERAKKAISDGKTREQFLSELSSVDRDRALDAMEAYRSETERQSEQTHPPTIEQQTQADHRPAPTAGAANQHTR